jgi:hypothetical protein
MMILGIEYEVSFEITPTINNTLIIIGIVKSPKKDNATDDLYLKNKFA